MSDPFPTIRHADVAWVTAAQMAEIDDVMVTQLGIDLVQMMENAGRSLADLVIHVAASRSVTVVAGGGGNGGGGLAAARHLHNLGVDVSVQLTAPDRMTEVPGRQLHALQQMGVEISDAGTRPINSAVVVDAMVGYSLSGELRGAVAHMVGELAGTTVVSLDVPSGLDATTGEANRAVAADFTLTLCLPKVGLRGSANAGHLHLADISVPPSVVASYGAIPPFHKGRILRVEKP